MKIINWRLSISGVIALALTSALGPPSRPVEAQAGATRDFEIRTLSSRPDMISGGDVLVQMTLPSSAKADTASISLNGRNIKPAFRAGQESRSLVGLVGGLPLGRSELELSASGKSQAKLTLVNHPLAGPVISGPHQTPFVCETEALGLGPALDADCGVKTRVDYFYRSNEPLAAAVPPAQGGAATAPNPWKPFNPAAPGPADLAMTTTTEGRTVPFVVRRETGTINRAVYSIAFLHEPGQPLPTPWSNTSAWNGRLVYTFGGGCGAGHRQGRTIGGLAAARNHLEDGQLGDYAIAKGYALAGASLNVFGTSCNDVISAETVMMVKERFIEQFGVPRFTIGSGGSGGAMQQHLIANNYPGLLDGIMPAISFADHVTFLTPLFDCELLDHATQTSSLPWTDEEKRAVAGHGIRGYCIRNGTRFPDMRAATNFDPMFIPAKLAYHPATNPKGARFTFQDNLINVFGRDPKTGFARRPYDNVGVQYGLGALNEGKISLEQFLDLNRRVGGFDIDGNIIAERTVANPEALRIVYQTGRLNDASRGLSTVPIIDARRYTDKILDIPDVHDIVAGHITRARLVAANGHADNQVFRTYPTPTQSPTVQPDNLDMMDKWLSNIAHDGKPARTKLEKIVRNKPAEAVDACFTESLERITDPARCRELYPVFSNPRLVAGAPLTADRLKCELKPIDRKDYKQPLTDAELASLRAIFPQGVCDYSRRGVAQRAPDTWLSYPLNGAGQSF